MFFQDDDRFHYELNFITIDRLGVEVKRCLEKGENCFADVGLVTLDSITRGAIVNAVRSLIKNAIS